MEGVRNGSGQSDRDVDACFIGALAAASSLSNLDRFRSGARIATGDNGTESLRPAIGSGLQERESTRRSGGREELSRTVGRDGEGGASDGRGGQTRGNGVLNNVGSNRVRR